MNIQQALAEAVTALQSSSDSALLDAEILLAHCLNQSRSSLRARPLQDLRDDQLNEFRAFIARRQEHVPIAYLIGRKEFWSLDLEVNEHTLVPRPETELIVETVLELYPATNESLRVLDLGTGSGAIALALQSERPSWDISAVDISESALVVASKNAQRLGLTRISFYSGNWFTALPAGEFDLVVSNPPYLSEAEWPAYAASLTNEPREALVSGHDGLDAIRHIVSEARWRIRPGGYLLIEHGFAQGAAVCALLELSGCTNVRTLTDLAGLGRVSLGQY